MEDLNTKNKAQQNELMTILNELNQPPEEDSHSDLEDTFIQESKAQNEITILNLPPRKEIHGQKKNRTHLKIRRPFMRLLVVVLLLFAVLGILIIFSEEIVSL